MVPEDSTALYHEWEGLERLAQTGAPYALAIVRTKLRAVQTALKIGTVFAPELVRKPIQVDASVRAGVAVYVHLPLPPHHDHIDVFSSGRLYFHGAGIRLTQSGIIDQVIQHVCPLGYICYASARALSESGTV